MRRCDRVDALRGLRALPAPRPATTLQNGPRNVARPALTPQRPAHAPPVSCAALPLSTTCTSSSGYSTSFSPSPVSPLPGGVLGLSGPQLPGLDLDATAPQEGRRFDMQVGVGGGAGRQGDLQGSGGQDARAEGRASACKVSSRRRDTIPRSRQE